MKKRLFLKIFLVLGTVVLGVVIWWSRSSQVGVKGAGQVGDEGTRALVSGRGFKLDAEEAGKENLEKLEEGCPFRDCIPSIDRPRFEGAAEADLWLKDEDVVFGLDWQGQQRAYPQRILNWHEIVNDEVGGDPIAITFCPLCGSAIAFERRIEDGRVLEFGVSGKLFNSNLVMYDRQTESLWQQIGGEAIAGELYGTELAAIGLDSLQWSEWKEAYPQTRVLSRATGYSRDYNRYPYGAYEQNEELLYGVEVGMEEEIFPKTVVYGIEVGGEHKAYTKEAVERETEDDGVINDRVGGQRIRLSYSNGEVFVENLSRREELEVIRLFWFAWKAFYPESEIYE